MEPDSCTMFPASFTKSTVLRTSNLASKDDPNTNNEEYIPDELVLTRYLYPKIYVKQSLMLALLDHQYDESLYWAYELYFSGFEDEMYDFVFQLYNEIYRFDNPTLIKFMESTRSVWITNTLQYWLIGSIIATLSRCDYRMDNFVKNYFKVNCVHIEKPKKRTFIIRMCELDIYEYKTNRPISQCYKYLSLVCRYSIRTNINQLFMGDFRDLETKWHQNWIFYACLSPIWQERLDDFDGRVNIEKKAVEFDNEKSEEAFYDRWNLDTDEQSVIIKQSILGDKRVPQITMKEFCEMYGCPLVTKSIKMKK